MKAYKIVLFLTALHIASISFSQGIDFNYDSKEIQSILNGTMYVIPTGDKIFDDSLKIAVEQYWKVSPFKILLKEEADSYLKDENNYFLAPVTALGNNGKSPDSYMVSPLSSDNYRTIYVFHGGKHSKMTNLQYQDYIDCQLVFWFKENAAHGLGYVVKNLNDNIEIVTSKKIKSNSNLSNRWNPLITQEFSKNANILKTKVLLVDKNASYYINEKVLKIYNYKYQILGTSEIISLLYQDPKKYCFLSDHVIYSGEIDIYDPETKSLIYSSVKTGGGGSWKVSSKQIEALNAAIDKK